jgi:hypothetical protein
MRRISIFECRISGSGNFTGTGCRVAASGIHRGMYIGSRHIHFKDQSSSFCRSVLSLLAALAVGFVIPAREAAQSAPPSASAPPAQSQAPNEAKSGARQFKSQTTPSHTGPARKTHQAHKAAAHRAGARPATGKSGGARLSAKSAATKSPTAKSAPTRSAAYSRGTKAGKKRGSSKGAHLSTRQARRIYMAHLHPGTDRVTAIQQKLAEVGYLKEEPNGQWDNQTREAMRHYQEDNGFPATGLPEAKSLMKLGLGPHPLPPELDRPHPQAGDSPSGSR